MRVLLGVVMLGAALSGCQNRYGAMLVTLTFTNETKTQCVTVGVPGIAPLVTPRNGRNRLEFAISESGDLTGNVEVSVQRYASTDCSGTPVGAIEKKTGTLTHNVISKIEFVFGGESPDAGALDAGVDAGCSQAECAARTPVCRTSAACVSGQCDFMLAARGSSCGDGGACSQTGDCVSVCAANEAGGDCNDNLACTTDKCSNTLTCVGTCKDSATPPPCMKERVPRACASESACAYDALSDDTTCDTAGSTGKRCASGMCLQGLPFDATTIGPSITAYDYPTGDWVTTAGCVATIDTDRSPPAPLDTWCSTTRPTVKVMNTAEGSVAVFAMNNLTVAAGSTIRFIGAKRVVLVVINDATISGTISASSDETFASSAAPDSDCADSKGKNGTGTSGGGGGALAAAGGAGAGNLGSGGVGNIPTPVTLRGGCSGGTSGAAAGGKGGGALQLSVGHTLAVTGVIGASGAGGRGGTVSGASGYGGGGGGSGGMLILEATNVTLAAGSLLVVNGGGGGGGGGSQAGTAGSIVNATAAAGGASSNGGAGAGGAGSTMSMGGSPGADTGGGGGGGAGLVYLRNVGGSCTKMGMISGSNRGVCQ